MSVGIGGHTGAVPHRHDGGAYQRLIVAGIGDRTGDGALAVALGHHAK